MLLFRPRRVAAGANQWSWAKVWAVHALGLAIAGGVLFYWTTVEDMISASRLLDQLTEVSGLVEVLTSALTIAMGFFLLGIVLAAWGAGDETCLQSIAAATKRLFALTPHLAVVGSALLWSLWWFYEVQHDPGVWEFDPVREAAGPLAVTGAVYYAIVLVLMTLAAGRSRARCRWPAQCEGCNYSLLHLDASGCCPECGLPVKRTLKPEARPGLWRGRSNAPWVSLWCLFHPKRCGAEVQLFDSQQKMGKCFVVSLLWVACTFVTGHLLGTVLEATAYDYSYDNEDWFFVTLASVMIAGLFCLFVLLVTVGTASLSGAAAGRGVKRNLMPAAMQLAVRMSGSWMLLVLCTLSIFALIIISEGRGLDLDDWARAMGWDPVLLRLMIIFGLLVLFLLLWTVQLARATRAARFSNV